MAERRQAEAALRLAQFTIDNTSEAIFWFGPDGRFFYVNEAACSSLGYTREELTALHITDINPDFPREPWEQSWQRIQRESLPRRRHGPLAHDSCPARPRPPAPRPGRLAAPHPGHLPPDL
ncbi:MAG: PAS domain S-box protein [Candidatus Handelsmanbacteria bacterium]|nr:PAS domain S-box protein [Candidatus Handelsmanbacteria bacterium]